MELPEDARTYVQHAPIAFGPDKAFYAFAVIGEGKETQVVAHGFGPTREEAEATMVPCSKPDKTKKARARRAPSTLA